MDKTTIRFGKKLQSVMRKDPRFWDEPTLQTAYAFIAFVTAMLASCEMPVKTFRSDPKNVNLTSGLALSPQELTFLKPIYPLTDRIAVEIELGARINLMDVTLNFYGNGKRQHPYARFKGKIEGDCVREFPINLFV